MAGIYIHIPFCKQRCTYCDFYKELSGNNMTKYADAISAEIALRKDYLSESIVFTIYFGGGTPSVIPLDGLKRILDSVHDNFNISKEVEITLEANPDDLNESYLADILNLGFNRLSIGIQTFNDQQLKFLNRRHSGNQAINAVHNAQKAGFDNISIDLIYGIPGQDINDWELQLDKALALNVQHISAYGLTYEPGTRLFNQRNDGLVAETDDEVMIEMFNLMLLKFNEMGIAQYEISNFCKPGYQSKHNSSYWQAVPYIGLGPSAHSYDGESRQWNESSLEIYYQNIHKGIVPFENEKLSLNDKYNDYVMISLRTTQGANTLKINEDFGSDYYDYFLNSMKSFIEKNLLIHEKTHVKLSQHGVQLANTVISGLMKTD